MALGRSESALFSYVGKQKSKGVTSREGQIESSKRRRRRSPRILNDPQNLIP